MPPEFKPPPIPAAGNSILPAGDSSPGLSIAFCASFSYTLHIPVTSYCMYEDYALAGRWALHQAVFWPRPKVVTIVNSFVDFLIQPLGSKSNDLIPFAMYVPKTWEKSIIDEIVCDCT